MGLRQGAWEGPQQEWQKQQQQHDEKEVVEDAQSLDRRFLQMAFQLPLLSVTPLFFPLWCSAHWGSVKIGKYSPIDPAVAARQEFEQETVCGCEEGSVWGAAFKRSPRQYFTLSSILFRLSSKKGAKSELNFESWLYAFEKSKNIYLCINAKSKPNDFMFYVWPLGLTGGRISHLLDVQCGWKGKSSWQRKL